MMRRIFALALLGSFACSSEGSKQPTDAAKQPETKQPETKRPEEAKPKELPEHMGGELVTITPELARAKGLALGFSLDFTDTAFSVSPFSNGGYVHASGPPGGPLVLRVSAATRNADLATIAGGGKLETKPTPEEIDVLGAKRPALAWITGESLARTSWCAFVVAPETGDDALLFELGVGHSGEDITCKTALGHDELAKVVGSLRFP
jgi:hypothetical protein